MPEEFAWHAVSTLVTQITQVLSHIAADATADVLPNAQEGARSGQCLDVRNIAGMTGDDDAHI